MECLDGTARSLEEKRSDRLRSPWLLMVVEVFGRWAWLRCVSCVGCGVEVVGVAVVKSSESSAELSRGGI